MTVAKKTVQTSLCPHEHIATLLSDPQPAADGAAAQAQPVAAVPKFPESVWTANTSAYLYQNRKLDMSVSQETGGEENLGDWSSGLASRYQ